MLIISFLQLEETQQLSHSLTDIFVPLFLQCCHSYYSSWTLMSYQLCSTRPRNLAPANWWKIIKSFVTLSKHSFYKCIKIPNIWKELLLLLSPFSRVWPQRQQPTRLPCPWDSPGKNTGVGCHFLLQCMKVKSESELAQSCPTLCNPMDCSLPGSSVHGIFQARILEWFAIAFSG